MVSTRLTAVLALLIAQGALGCRASGSSPLVRPTKDDAGTGGLIIEGGATPPTDAPMAMPHALLAIQPAHGPYSGGTLVLLRGNGFGSNARVWFGDTELDAASVLAIDTKRLQVTAPPGAAGLVDVTVQNGDDESTTVALSGGYSYDAFYAEPATGPTSGGTLVTLHGQGTHWNETTEVSIDRNPCDIVEVRSETELVCRAPLGTPGAKPVRVEGPDDEIIDVLDAFTYENSDNGFRGGLSGDPLRGELKVIALDSMLGEVIPGAYAILGDDDPLVARTDLNGVALLTGSAVGRTATVTVARKCFQPVTFVDVPVDTVTAYLDPVLSPSCFSPEGDIEGGGGNPGTGSSVSGELVWPETQEFRRNNWGNVPAPASDNESKVAYVFPLSARPTDVFRVPTWNSPVTTSDMGSTGFRFSLSASAGTYTLYALAGIEQRGPAGVKFTAYATGLVRGVAVPLGKSVGDVFIPVDVPLDHAMTLQIDGPKPTPVGPDRLDASVAIRVGSEGYMILPGGQQEALLGMNQSLEFVGVPPLVDSLEGTSYVIAASASTGPAGGLPRSVLGFLGVTTTANALQVGPFIEVPVAVQPARNGVWNGRDLAWDAAPGGLTPDLAIIDVQTAAGLFDWRVVVPGRKRAVRLPDLAAIDSTLAWPTGEQGVQIALAQVLDFDYGNLRYRNLIERGWGAYAMDAFFVSY